MRLATTMLARRGRPCRPDLGARRVVLAGETRLYLEGTTRSRVEKPARMLGAMRQAISLNGPIGAGKTTLGRALATALGAAFIDSDDFRDRSKRWFEETLTLANALVRAGTSALEERPVLVIAMPLRAREWIFFSRAVRCGGDRDLLCHLGRGL
jgi:hypothetical protein